MTISIKPTATDTTIQNNGSDIFTIGSSGITMASGKGIDGLPASGITEADQWRLTANWSTVAPITSGWERNDTAGYGTLGTGMTESSGIFTFPSTGIWFIQFNSYTNASSASLYTRTDIEVTINNSTYVQGAVSYASSYTTTAYNSQCSTFIFDVTDTTTHKTRFALGQNASGTPSVKGSTTIQSSGVTFIRLGDT